MTPHRQRRNAVSGSAIAAAILSAMFCWSCLSSHEALAQKPKDPGPPAAKAAPATKPSLDEAWEMIPKYEFGQSRLPLTVVDEYVRGLTDPQEKAKVSTRLAGLLGASATAECKRFICRELVYVGGAEALPALAALLPNEELSDMARYAMERMNVPGVDEALRGALGKTKGKIQVGLINSLGERRDAQAVTAIADLLSANTVSNVELSAAAAAALGKIGTPEATKAMEKAYKNLGSVSPHADLPRYKAAVEDAYLSCADRLLQAGKKDEAGAIYKETYAAGQPGRARVAALRGLAVVQGEAVLPLLLEVLNGNDEPMRVIAVALIKDIPGAAVTGALVTAMPKMAPASQAAVLDVLAARGDPAARPAVVEAAKSKDDAVRLAAIRALGRLGDAGTVSLLAQTAAGGSDAERSAARASLDAIPSKDVEPAMVKALENPDPKVRVELLRTLAARRAPEAPATLLKCAEDADATVRLEALNGLGLVADEKDLPAMVKLVVKSQPDNERQAGEKALTATCLRIADPAKTADPVLAAMSGAEVPARCSLLRVLGTIGGEKALQAVRAALKEENAAIQDAAVRAIKDWPDASAAPDALQIAKTSSKQTHQVLALQGYVRMVGLMKDVKPEEKLKLYQGAMELARRPEEKRLVLAGVADVPTMAALNMVAPFLDQDGMKEEAAAAAVGIADKLPGPHSPEVGPIMQKVAQTAKNKEVLRRAGQILQKVPKEKPKK